MGTRQVSVEEGKIKKGGVGVAMRLEKRNYVIHFPYKDHAKPELSQTIKRIADVIFLRDSAWLYISNEPRQVQLKVIVQKVGAARKLTDIIKEYGLSAEQKSEDIEKMIEEGNRKKGNQVVELRRGMTADYIHYLLNANCFFPAK